MRTRPGNPYPLGATWDGAGVNFALFSEHATAVDLCLFGGREGTHEITRIPMREQTHQVWHIYLPEAGPGRRYGYRVHGPYDPASGQRFNPAKLLLDPYAKAIDGTIRWSDALFGYQVGHPDADLSRDDRDSAWSLPKSVVIDPAFTWGDDRPPRIPWNETIIYEVHVKSFTARHPDVPKALRATYAGLACPAAIDYLRSLGITAVELLPIQQFVADKHLVERGLTNYWGYNSIGFFVPDVRLASDGRLGRQVTDGVHPARPSAGREVGGDPGHPDARRAPPAPADEGRGGLRAGGSQSERAATPGEAVRQGYAPTTPRLVGGWSSTLSESCALCTRTGMRRKWTAGRRGG